MSLKRELVVGLSHPKEAELRELVQSVAETKQRLFPLLLIFAKASGKTVLVDGVEDKFDPSFIVSGDETEIAKFRSKVKDFAASEPAISFVEPWGLGSHVS